MRLNVGSLLAPLKVGVGSSNRPSNGVKSEAVGLGRELDLRAYMEESKVTRNEVVGDASSDVLLNTLILNELVG